MSEANVRPVERPGDDAAIRALDRSYLTGEVFAAAPSKGGLVLKRRALASALRRGYPLDLATPAWTHAWVATRGGRVVGFAATEYAAWNRRLILWHFYVDAAARRTGVGRSLMAAAITHGRAVGAVACWVETSNFNAPGVDAYRRLGFELAGFDLSLYAGTAAAGEFALFLSRLL